MWTIFAPLAFGNPWAYDIHPGFVWRLHFSARTQVPAAFLCDAAVQSDVPRCVPLPRLLRAGTGANMDMFPLYYHHVLTVCASQTLSKYYLVMLDDSHLSHMAKPSVIARLWPKLGYTSR